jgi:hypothetical protein
VLPGQCAYKGGVGLRNGKRVEATGLGDELAKGDELAEDSRMTPALA